MEVLGVWDDRSVDHCGALPLTTSERNSPTASLRNTLSIPCSHSFRDHEKCGTRLGLHNIGIKDMKFKIQKGICAPSNLHKLPTLQVEYDPVQYGGIAYLEGPMLLYFKQFDSYIERTIEVDAGLKEDWLQHFWQHEVFFTL